MALDSQSIKTNKRWAKLIAIIGLSASAMLAPFLASNEGVVTTTYWDRMGKVWTVCAGETSPEYAIPGVTYTYDECLDMLAERLPAYAQAVVNCTPVVLKNPELTVAAIDLAYNIGTGAYCKSTAAKHFNAGRYEQGCEAVTWWDKAGGKTQPGLVIRREKDAAYCLRAAANLRAAEKAGIYQ